MNALVNRTIRGKTKFNWGTIEYFCRCLPRLLSLSVLLWFLLAQAAESVAKEGKQIKSNHDQGVRLNMHTFTFKELFTHRFHDIMPVKNTYIIRSKYFIVFGNFIASLDKWR